MSEFAPGNRNELSQTTSFGPIGSHLYGDRVPLSATASSGLPVTFSVISGPGSLAADTLTVTGIGTVTVAATQVGNSTYAAAIPVDEAIVVNPAPLTITADNQTMAYGTALPTLTASSASYSGFVNGDTPTSLAKLPTLTTTATFAAFIPINVSGASDPDYNISYVSGTLTVTILHRLRPRSILPT